MPYDGTGITRFWLCPRCGAQNYGTEKYLPPCKCGYSPCLSCGREFTPEEFDVFGRPTQVFCSACVPADGLPAEDIYKGVRRWEAIERGERREHA